MGERTLPCLPILFSNINTLNRSTLNIRQFSDLHGLNLHRLHSAQYSHPNFPCLTCWSVVEFKLSLANFVTNKIWIHLCIIDDLLVFIPIF